MPINNFLLPGAKVTTGYDVANSCRFNDDDSAYMHKTPSGAGNRRTWTFSCWAKVGTPAHHSTYFGANNAFQLEFHSSGAMLAWKTGGDFMKTNALYRDPSAWMHIVWAFDTTQGTASNRVKLYINGTQVTSWATASYPSENEELEINNTVAHYVGDYHTGTSENMDGYLAEVCLIDGTAYAASDFGEFDEDTPTVWKPKDVSGLTFGTNGFYLDFEDSSNLGNDANGGTDLTEVNLAATDQSTDTCTNNFCTLNPLKHNTTLSEGNLKCVTGTGTSQVATSTFAPNAGKWFWEVRVDTKTALMIGVADVDASLANSDWQASGGYYYYNTGVTYHNNSSSSYGDSWDDDDIIGVALDLDNNKIYFSKNGTFQNSGDPTSGSSGTGAAFTLTGQYFPALSNGSSHSGATAQMNFGSPPYSESGGNSDGNGYGNFAGSVPSGYYALNSKNLAEYG